MHWLDDGKEAKEEPSEAPPSSRRGPPRLPGLPEIPPMPVVSTAEPAPVNKTIEVEPQWLELVEERRAERARKGEAAASAPAPAKKAVAAARSEPSARPVSPADASRPRPRIRPIIPREDE